jgi:hypothetical protein
VQIQHHLHIVFLNRFFNVVDDGLVDFVGISPLSVRIAATELCSAVTMHHSIDVHHRHYLYDEVVKQKLSLGLVRQQKLDHPFSHKT